MPLQHQVVDITFPLIPFWKESATELSFETSGL